LLEAVLADIDAEKSAPRTPRPIRRRKPKRSY
jgi:hypothetical protein